MEIESKFLVPEEIDFKALENLSKLASYTISEAQIQVIEDTFLDTKNKDIMAAGYYLRVRKAAGEKGKWVTIKSLGGFEGGTHRREEYASFLPEGLSVLECPSLRIRDMIFDFTSGLDLTPLITLKQKRIIRQLNLEKKLVAEIYLDRVNLKSESRKKFYNEFEVELKSEGTVKDLEAVRDFLLDNYNLEESRFSKFERAYLFRENLPEKTFLNMRERAVCAQLANHKNVYGKQAKILLLLDRGSSPSEISLLIKIPEPEVEALLSRFEKERLSIFPFTGAKEKIPGKNPIFYFQSERGSPVKGWTEIGYKEWTPETLLKFYGVDREKAENIKAGTLALFDGLSAYHGLGKEEKELLSFSALLHGIGSSVSRGEEALMNREILLTHPVKGLKLSELRMLALITELQSPEISEKKLPAALEENNTGLSPAFQNKTLILAAFLRIANLSETGAQDFFPCRFRQLEGTVEIELTGLDAEKTAKKAEKRSELWEYLFSTKLRFTQAREPPVSGDSEKTLEKTREKIEEKVEEKAEEKAEKKTEKKKRKESQKFTVSPEDSMAFVAHRIFAYQFSQMLAHEKGTRKGEDIEELHDMRVAVRRTRAAATVFNKYLESEKLEPHLKGLKRTLGALGGVRDLDVFREKAETYLETLPTGHEHDLDLLFVTLTEEREKARENMLEYLDSEKYSRIKKDFSEFLEFPETWAFPTTTKKHDALPHRVKDVLPSILYARLADISAYSEWVEGPYVSVERLHRLRIAAKGLRYTLEFFESVLGKEVGSLIKDFKVLQDHLGDLHDAVVATDMLGFYLKTGTWNPSESEEVPNETQVSESSGVEAYLAYREEELLTLLNTFPDAWEKVRAGDFRKRIESVIRSLYESL
ncbi:TPA: CHAD domain-containing protein [Methanosarcina acetivorans]|nr:CHAD domain-containing protein [Methanosarcina acetivorans]HIH93215.1 CHAD domain-containing protein [Methanosarcina acetivorans]